MALGDFDYLDGLASPKVILALLITVLLSWKIVFAISTAYASPLSVFPGPKTAALTRYWHAFVECILNRSFYDVLVGLHEKHGEIVRIGPKELHFANPQAYHDIYNGQNRWDKEKRLYHGFGEDRSSFGFLTYNEAKPRKDVLSKRFSSKAVVEAQLLVQDKIDALCEALRRCAAQSQAVHVGHAFRCMTIDVITYLCFGKSVDAIQAPQFEAPIVLALDASAPVLVRFKHSDLYKNMIQKCPPKLAKIISPETSGLIDLQQIISGQIKDFSESPRKLDLLPHSLTIYHLLMSPKEGTSIGPGSLYEEAQALMFAGGDTVGNALQAITYFLSTDPTRQEKLRSEIDKAWADSSGKPPSLPTLEQLPYFNAVIKEGLRYSHGVVAGLLRIVPAEGAAIAGTFVPGGTIVSCAAPFVHLNADVFAEPLKFIPERWIEDPSLDKWLVAFSKGPRSCLGINLAWLEMRMALSSVYHNFHIKLDASSPEKLEFGDAFLPAWRGAVKATFEPGAA